MTHHARKEIGRPREFDVEEVVGRAMEVFQTNGYEGTSLVDLLEGTGLSRGSLYKAFGDKKTLFLAALDRYTAENSGNLKRNLEAGHPYEAIQAALFAIAKASSFTSGERGCLVVGSAAEMAGKDPDIKGRLKQTFSRMQGLLKAAIVRGQKQGAINSEQSPDALARYLLCLIEGLGILGKTGRAEKEMVEIVNVALRALK